MKTNKSFSKRIKVTRTGKLKVRKSGFNHFNAKQSRRTQLAGKVPVTIKLSNKTKSREYKLR